jgi:hypothetical protein
VIPSYKTFALCNANPVFFAHHGLNLLPTLKNLNVIPHILSFAMQFNTFAAAATILAGVFVNAVVFPEVFLQERCGGDVASSQQFCSCTDSFDKRSYEVLIGQSYDEALCAKAESTLKASFPALMGWSCLSNGCGMFDVLFTIAN